MSAQQPLSFYVPELRFSGGQAIAIEPGDLIVIVGPNNSGKSSCLKEIQLGCGKHDVGPVLDHCGLEGKLSVENVTEWLTDHVHIEQSTQPTFRWLNAEVLRRDLPFEVHDPKEGMSRISKFLVSLTDTETRLSTVKPQEAIASGGPPSHPFHVLFSDLEKEKKLSDFFERTFGTELILQRVGKHNSLHCGRRPANVDTVSFCVGELTGLPALHNQGDGMKGFVGTLLNRLTSPAFVHLIDEPEAFLHPPQAHQMGQIIGELQSHDRSTQLIVSTHSGDFLRGLIDSNPPRMRIIRLTRKTDCRGSETNHIQELSVDKLQSLWADPVMRFSNALDAVFHEGCVVCEYEADCLFYSAIADSLQFESKPDIKYLGSGGKHGMKKVVDTLVSLGVPTTIIADFDVLNASDPLSTLVAQLGGEWSVVQNSWQQVKSEVEVKKLPLTLNQVRDRLTAVLDAESDNYVSQDTADKVRETIKAVSPWSEPKRLGLAYLDGGTRVKADRLIEDVAQLGLWVVPVGEMEGFVSEFRTSNRKGSKWVAHVFRECADLENDERLTAARAFMRGVITHLSATVNGKSTD